MSNSTIHISSNKDDLVKEFTDFFLKKLEAKSGNFSVALSGGSTPKVWFEYLSSLPKGSMDWDRIHFYWGDERCVPPEHEDSNYGMTREYLLDRINIPQENIHRILGENPPEQADKQYAKELEVGLDKPPVFDLIILGMGDDGHTASIFPHEIHLWHAPENCVVATHPDSGQKRVSLTGSVINGASSVAFLVTGENKSQKIEEIINGQPIARNYPASLVQPQSNDLHWFLDAAAAKLIQDDQ